MVDVGFFVLVRGDDVVCLQIFHLTPASNVGLNIVLVYTTSTPAAVLTAPFAVHPSRRLQKVTAVLFYFHSEHLQVRSIIQPNSSII